MQNHEGQTRILRPNPRGEFDYYYNPGDDSDFGDTVQFLTRELFGNYAQKLTRQQYIQLEQAIRAVDPAASVTEHTQQALTVFDLSRHDLRALEHLQQLSVPDLYLLQQRGIAAQTLLEPRFAPSMCIKHSIVGGKEYQNLLFLWRDATDRVVGGQYKYLKDGVCHKHFLMGTARGSSLWYSDLSNAKKLLVCEDPLDALAHRLLLGDGVGEYAYAATGGRVTERQIALLYWLAERDGFQVVLGNDNDTAGAVANLRIADRWGSVAIDHDHDRGTVTVRSRQDDELLFAGSEDSFKSYVTTYAATHHHISIERPTHKDWNAQLLGCRL